MMVRRFFSLFSGLFLLLTAAAVPAFSAPKEVPPPAETKLFDFVKSGELVICPLFENAGFYYRALPGRLSGLAGLRGEFRETGGGKWRSATIPVIDRPADVLKGSALGLKEGTKYEFRLVDGGGTVVAAKEFQTWNSNVPVARTVDISRLPRENGIIVIRDKGKPNGWIRLTVPKGYVLRGVENGENVIRFEGAAYVILENAVLEGGSWSAVLVKDSRDVRIVNCEISGWGTPGVRSWRIDRPGQFWVGKANVNYQAGVSISRSLNTVVERCYVHDPKSRANSWQFSHPAGPCAVYASATLGGNVIRRNDFVGSDEHRFNDVIEASENSEDNGGFFRDSDIYENFLAFSNDDGIELEGGGINVRFFNNRIEGTFCGTSTGSCRFGPMLIYDNLIARLGDETGNSCIAFKNGGGAQYGQRLFVNNTVYAPTTAPYNPYGGAFPGIRMAFSRNNLIFSGALAGLNGQILTDDLNHDLFWSGSPAVAEKNLEAFRKFRQESEGMAADPKFRGVPANDFRPGDGSPAIGKAVPVPGFPAWKDLGMSVSKDHWNRPVRALGVTADKQHFTFAPPNCEEEFTLTYPAAASGPVTLRLQKNKVADFFTVTPSSVTIYPGETVKASLRFLPEKFQGYPRRVGAFLYRSEAGLSVPFTVEGRLPFDVMEAVSNAISQSEKFPVKTVFDRQHREFTGTLRILGRGSYYMVARLRSPIHRKNSRFEVTLDGRKLETPGLSLQYRFLPDEKDYRFIYFGIVGGMDAGTYSVTVRRVRGEEAVEIDTIYFTQDPEPFFDNFFQQERK